MAFKMKAWCGPLVSRSPSRRRLALLLGASFALSGAAAEPVVVSALDGAEVSLAPGQDEALIIHFWATWCDSCREEFPVLNAALAG